MARYRYTQRSKKDSGETSFLESRLQPDSFFGASGGQRIDTRDAAGSSSSMTYSLSQLDAIGDVDPVAEADVYLAYGRDLQAEEILKEAMRSNPERLAIRTKLLEVYAKRRDIKGFELLATQLFALTRGEGDDWAKAQELGAQIDPENPMYRAGGSAGAAARRRRGRRAARREHAAAVDHPGAVAVRRRRSPSRRSATAPSTTSTSTSTTRTSARRRVRRRSTPPRRSPPRPAAEPAIFNATTLKMPLVANEAGSAPDRRDEPLPFDLSGISLDLDQPVDGRRRIRTPRRAASPSTTATAAIRCRASSSSPRSSSASATRTARAICCARCSRPRAARTKTKAQGMLDRIS